MLFEGYGGPVLQDEKILEIGYTMCTHFLPLNSTLNEYAGQVHDLCVFFNHNLK